MNVAACATGVACAVALVTGVSVGMPDLAANAGALAEKVFFAPSGIVWAPLSENLAITALACDAADASQCPAPEDPAKVFVAPAPSGDARRDFAILQKAIDDKQYNVIDGASGADRQVYTINGMLEVTRSLTIRNLELKQVDSDYAVRTIYAAGGATPITLRLENLKIQRGPADSESSGSVSDSAAIWTTNVTPEFKNIEIYGGGKGRGLQIGNALGGHLTDIYVHDITWEPYAEDRNDQAFWNSFTLASLQKMNNWNGLTIHDFDGHNLRTVRIEEQVYGIVLDNVTGIKVVRPHVERLMTRFADGQLYPYQTDGLTVVSGNDITIQDARISHVAEGIDVPGYPARAIDISNATVSDAPIFCFKTRGSYDSNAYSLAEGDKSVTIRNSVASRCGMAAYTAAAGADVWIQDSQAIDTGLGPDGSATPGIGGVAAYRFLQSSSLPTLDGQSRPIGMHIVNAKVDNEHSKYMQAVFHSENDPKDRRTYAGAHNYAVSNPTKPDVRLSTNFTVVENDPAPNLPETGPAASTPVSPTPEAVTAETASAAQAPS